MNPRRFVPFAALSALVCPMAVAQDKKGAELEVPSFRGEVLDMRVEAKRLGIVVDISESMTRALPGIRAELKEKLPRSPAVHVDGCGLVKPEPDARFSRGVATDTVTAVETLGKHARVDAVLWICDMGDPPNKYGVEAMARTLEDHGIRLYLLSFRNKPGPSVRKLVFESEGEWKVR